MNREMGKTILMLTIPLPPATKKNHQQIRFSGGKSWIAQSERYRQYEADCLRLITGTYRKHIACPVNIKAVYYMPNARRVDISNLHSALHDVLVKAGVLKDDSSLSPRIVAGTDGSRVCIDRQHPRTEIEITEWEETENEKQ